MLTRKLLVLVAVLACAACGRTSPTSIPNVDMPNAADTERLAAASNAFGFDLWMRLKSRPGNLALSPASISTALAMTWGGARGQTEQQMRKVLRIDGDQQRTAAQWGRLSLALQNPSRRLKLRIANRLFGERSFKFQQPFLDMTASAFAAPLEPLDFKQSPDPSRRRINSWVEDQTEHRIKDLLPPPSVKNDTRLVLVNAIYFLAEWATQFKHEATFAAPFTVSPGNPKSVPTMHMMSRLRLAQADGVKMLEMPYVGGDAAMLIVLPDQPDGLAGVEARLSPARLAALSTSLAEQNVEVALPRFEISPQLSAALRPELEPMGMALAFDAEQADLTGMGVPADPRNRLFVSDVFHKAFVKVDEKGTEAAAATAVVTTEGAGAPPRAIPFHADHPFLFFIVDKQSNLILFMGRVADPS